MNSFIGFEFGLLVLKHNVLMSGSRLWSHESCDSKPYNFYTIQAEGEDQLQGQVEECHNDRLTTTWTVCMSLGLFFGFLDYVYLWFWIISLVLCLYW